jgi:hypothetical protein
MFPCEIKETPRQVVGRLLERLEALKSGGIEPTFPQDFSRRLVELRSQVGKTLQTKIDVWLIWLADVEGNKFKE